MPRIHLGMNTCFAVKRWPEQEDWLDVVASDLGLSTVQISLDLLPQTFDFGVARRYVERMRDLATSRGVTIHSLFTGLGAYSSNLLLSESRELRDAAFNWYRAVIDLTALAGAQGAGGHVGALSVSAAANGEARQALIDAQRSAMWKLSEHAAAAGLGHLQFENLAVAREIGHTIEEAHALEDSLAGSPVPWVLCLDVGHPPALGTDFRDSSPEQWLNEAWRSTPVIQLQQSGSGADRHGPFTALGNETGRVDRNSVLDCIRHWNADDVYLFFEIIHPHEADDALVLRELKESVEFWRSGLAEHSDS